MTPLDKFLSLGETVTIGSHTFEADEIMAFARKYDPQPFHVDEVAARNSVLGGLCASGWHTAAMWMKYNLRTRQDAISTPWEGPGPRPEFGPSPGFRNLKWLKPVYAGDTITFTKRTLDHRPLSSRPGWRLMSLMCEAFNASGAKVLEFESVVMLKTG